MTTFTETIKSMSRAELVGLLQHAPAVAEKIAAEERDNQAKAFQQRLRALDDLEANTAEIDRLKREADRLQPSVDAAHDAYVEKAAQLSAITSRIASMQAREGHLCGEISKAGEAPLEEAMQRCDAGVRMMASRVTELRTELSRDWGRTPEHSNFKERKRKEALMVRFEGYYRQFREAYKAATRLRYARISPADLAAKAAALVAPFDEFDYE